MPVGSGDHRKIPWKRYFDPEKALLSPKTHNLSLIFIHKVKHLDWSDPRRRKSADLAAKTGARGMDALVIQVAKEFHTELISFD